MMQELEDSLYPLLREVQTTMPVIHIATIVQLPYRIALQGNMVF